MIEIAWTFAAESDLERIAEYLLERAPEQAHRIAYEVYRAPEVLLSFPELGRPGRVVGTRELMVQHLPYVIVYLYRAPTISIVRVLHGAQRWP